MIRLAVIIVNFNGGELLPRCLRALKAQTACPARVLVIDNASTDGSVEASRSVAPWAEFHVLDTNVGFARGNNVGIQMTAECDWIALLNPDAFPEPGWIEAFERHATTAGDVDSFACRMLSAVDPGIADGAGDAYRVDGLAWARHQGRPSSTMPDHPEEVFAPCAGAAFYRRSAVAAVGGFCERFFCYYEDVDLGFRLRLRGGRCVYLPDAVVHHMGSAITGKASAFSVYHVHRNVVWTYLRNMPGRYVWWYLPAHLAANLATVTLFLLKGQGRTILRAKRDALLGVPAALAERRGIQAARRASPHAVLAVMERGHLLSTVVNRVFRSRG
jgi:GT2 family glycosyltransferase